MPTNRLSRLSFGPPRPPCRCCRVRRRLKRLKREVANVERLIGSVAEFIIPGMNGWARGERRTPRMYLKLDFEPCPPDANLASYAAGQLRKMGIELLSAADRVDAAEGLVSP